MDSRKPTPSQPSAAPARPANARREQLAQALRANLRRRKAAGAPRPGKAE